MQRLHKQDADLIIAGAGLASALVAARLAHAPSPPSILILERGDAPFADHTWSFHGSDLAQADQAWMRDLVAHSWPGYGVRFQNGDREISGAYHSLTSESVRAALLAMPHVTIRTGAEVASLQPDRAVLADGTELGARCVLDGRGFVPDPALVLGFQKFVGLEIETAEPHGLARPILMDATVPQLDGYRFIYCLPFAPNRVLVEDTRYSDDPRVEPGRFEAGIADFIAAQGWQAARVVRRETGSLPIALAFDAERFWQNRPADVPTIGLRAGLFHPTTGYSLPEGVAVANLVAEGWSAGSAALASRIRTHALDRARAQRFYRLLNRMLFRAAEPHERHRVLQRFYGLPAPLIAHFYAGQTSLREKMRILTGRPPVPVSRALRCLSERAALQGAQAQ